MNPLSMLYHRTRLLLNTLLGTRFNELIWRFRHIYRRGWAEGLITSASHPHRKLLAERISLHAPFRDVLEIGCATGPNLYVLAKTFPNVRYVGIDINPSAIKQGKIFFEKEKINNVSLLTAKADALRFSDKSFDIVFTDAVLMYIGPDKIMQVTEEIQRIARKAIVLVEHHSGEESPIGVNMGKWWLRNYVKLFQPYIRQARCTKITSDVWGGNWSRFGYIIEMEK
ncbi:class I SAM-dependent methyltransferase [Candidatus Bathyarchaeota archaeon]|nr:class I SAM-dependent methyltransferase [Candidatus Bathyarchaeota archaeon]